MAISSELGEQREVTLPQGTISTGSGEPVTRSCSCTARW